MRVRARLADIGIGMLHGYILLRAVEDGLIWPAVVSAAVLSLWLLPSVWERDA